MQFVVISSTGVPSSSQMALSTNVPEKYRTFFPYPAGDADD